MKVRHRAGSAHGFLVLRSEAGEILATGELTQMPSGNRIRQHVVFRFRDGSLDDETAIYSQHQTLRLISDHLVQRGKSFPTPCDIMIDELQQKVSVRATINGKEAVTSEHMTLPPDLANGVIFTLIENLQATDPRIEVPYLAFAGKMRMVKLAVTREEDEPFRVSGQSYKASKYAVKVNIGGLAGIVAPLIGKQPPDMHVWVSKTGVPAILRIDGPLYNDGPMWNIELASPVW